MHASIRPVCWCVFAAWLTCILPHARPCNDFDDFGVPSSDDEKAASLSRWPNHLLQLSPDRRRVTRKLDMMPAGLPMFATVVSSANDECYDHLWVPVL